jgi:2-keto-4-pentenoate hydratase
MGHPAGALVWLAEALGARGERIGAGSIVLSGGLAASVELRPQSVVTAEFDGLGFVGLHCT